MSPILSGIRTLALCNLLRRAADDQSAAAIAALRAKVEDIVSGLDNVQIMLDDNDRVACVHQLLQNIHKPVDICDMQTGRIGSSRI